MPSQSHVARRARGGRVDDAAILAASAHLTDRDRYLIRLVAEHRVLTTDQLCAAAFGNVITARHRLGVLVEIGMLRRFRPHRPAGSAPWHYLLGPLGAVLLGAEDRNDRKWLPQIRADRQLALERSQRLAHMTGRNWFFIALLRQARNGTGQLSEWLNETEAATLRYELPIGRQGESLPNPDGLGTWVQDGRGTRFLLEFDTGTEHLPVLAGKMSDYARLAEGLAVMGRECPVVLFCFPAPRREQTARNALATSREASRVRIATAALNPQTTSPAGLAWLPLSGPRSGPVRLADLATVMPDPFLNDRHTRAQRQQWEQVCYGQRPDWDGPDPEDLDDP